GGNVYARGVYGLIASLDQRYRIEYLMNPKRPVALSGYASGTGDDMADASIHGVGGDRIKYTGPNRAGFLGRLAYALARKPAIIVLDAPGVNEVMDGRLATDTIAYLDQLLTRIRAAGVWAVVTLIPNLLAASVTDAMR